MTHYKLRWRKPFLVVHRGDAQQTSSLSLSNGDQLRDCVRTSYADRVKLDLDFDGETLIFWAEACRQANKKIYISLPSALGMPQQQGQWNWWVKRSTDWLLAGLFLLLLSPIILSLMMFVSLTTEESVLVWQWHVGERGRLFRVVKLRTQDNAGQWLPLGEWIWRYRLDRLPKLWNVLCGEMGLVGSCPRQLADVAHLAKPWRYRLNALPGLLGAWQVEGRWMGLDERSLNRLDTRYLLGWSLLRELKFLFLALPMVMSSSDKSF
jgi:lipopolysaccharide/colanic/teichoic acid biosynthesis glycosyltransferase